RGEPVALAAPARRTTSLPVATALPELPDRRRSATRVLAGLAVAAAMAASLVTIVVPMMHDADPTEPPIAAPPLTITPLRGTVAPHPPPPDLVVLIEDYPRDPAVRAA